MDQEKTQGQEKDPKEDKSVALKKIIARCVAAKGFVFFVGILTDRVDDSGNNIIDFEYERHKMSFDDVKIAIREFKTALREDAVSFVDKEDEEKKES